VNQVMKQPSFWLYKGIKLNPSDKFRPFYFSEELQLKLESLLEKSKEQQLDADEQAEMVGLLELNKIFSFVNTQLATQQWQSTTSPANLSANGQDSSANIATP
jgi:hypothetical protein